MQWMAAVFPIEISRVPFNRAEVGESTPLPQIVHLGAEFLVMRRDIEPRRAAPSVAEFQPLRLKVLHRSLESRFADVQPAERETGMEDPGELLEDRIAHVTNTIAEHDRLWY